MDGFGILRLVIRGWGHIFYSIRSELPRKRISKVEETNPGKSPLVFNGV
jgi:hypothetical protein